MRAEQTYSKRLYQPRWRIESAFTAKGLQAYRDTLRRADAKLSRLCLSRRRSLWLFAIAAVWNNLL
jgi:hypothetical protein